ncbi:class I SAM-dependent methyltransferase, partial [Acinetobacter baumannii]
MSVLKKIQKVFAIDSSSVLLELGCGTGRSVFWFALVIHATVYGIEQIPIFMQQALKLKYRYQVSGAHFYMGNFLFVPWPEN